MITTVNMGLTAEKLFSQTDFTRKTWIAGGCGHTRGPPRPRRRFLSFEGEILPIEAEQADGTVMKVDSDQAVRTTPGRRAWPN